MPLALGTRSARRRSRSAQGAGRTRKLLGCRFVQNEESSCGKQTSRRAFVRRQRPDCTGGACRRTRTWRDKPGVARRWQGLTLLIDEMTRLCERTRALPRRWLIATSLRESECSTEQRTLALNRAEVARRCAGRVRESSRVAAPHKLLQTIAGASPVGLVLCSFDVHEVSW